MKLDRLNDKQKQLKATLEKIGVKAYFHKNTVRIYWPHGWGWKIRYTYAEAYKLARENAGHGKSVRPWAKDLKKETKRVTRAKVRDQIKKGEEDVHCSRKEASDPWKWD